MAHTTTRIKICGLTNALDVQASVDAGAHAVGFVFYEKSPRYILPALAKALIAALPPFVTPVGLFVNTPVSEVASIARQTGLGLLQFHGDETAKACAESARAAGLPFIRAIRVGEATSPADLLQYEQDYREQSDLFRGILLDTYVAAYGGSGKVFDWSVIPKDIAPRVVLSGGLNALNVADAIASVHPFAVDVSSGVELSKGKKDAIKIRAFIAAVSNADRPQP